MSRLIESASRRWAPGVALGATLTSVVTAVSRGGEGPESPSRQPADESVEGKRSADAKWGGGRTPSRSDLVALLGWQRALILRRLDQPLTPTELARILSAVPSVASHHLAVLERAKLIERVPEGRRVLVRRTAKAARLLAIYDR